MRKDAPRTTPAGQCDRHNSRSTARSGAVALVLGVAAVCAAHEAVADAAKKRYAIRLAQRTDQPHIKVASTIVAEPATEISLPIHVGPPRMLLEKSFVRLRGLPPTVSLSEGHAIGPGSWAVPLFALPTLKANIPTGISSRTEIVVSLIAMDGTHLAEARTALVVAASATMAPPAKTPVEPPQRLSSLGPAPVLSGEEARRGEQLVAQGELYLAQGKVAGARLFFRQAADTGLALGAIRLAATYDPTELSRLRVLGITPDIAEARKWYERARELGAPEAEQRLARLSGR